MDQRARDSRSLWRAATPKALSSPTRTRRLLFASCTKSFPKVKPTGKDEATAVRDDTRVLQARIPNWKLEKGGVKRWARAPRPTTPNMRTFCQVRRNQGEGRRQGSDHQRADRRDQQVRHQPDRRRGKGLQVSVEARRFPAAAVTRSELGDEIPSK
jgi:hypothetical protein